jgi:transcriptional regulator with XRE-family HTH domain
MSARRADASDVIVGHNIRLQRLARRLSQSDLARAVGVSFQQVQKYEKGVNRVGAGRLVRVAAALGVPVMTLLKGVPGLPHKAAPEVDDLLATPGRMRLMQAFAAIADGALRRSLITLTEDAARIGAGGRARSPRA